MELLERIYRDAKHSHRDDWMRGIPAITFNIWKKSYGGSQYDKTNDIYNSVVRNSMTGGRTQCFVPCPTNVSGDLYLLDCNALYASAMHNFEYPIGTSSTTTIEQYDKLGVYRCSINQSKMAIPVVPDRSGKQLNWVVNYPIDDTYLTSLDIQVARKYGATVTVYDGVIWNQKGTPFRSIIEQLFDEKSRTDDPELKEIAKIAMNSLSGKMIQENYLHFGTYIYSYARMWMYDLIYSKVARPYYTATDSILIDGADYRLLQNIDVANFGPILGSGLGQFRIDTQCDFAELRSPGVYLLYKNGQLIKDRTR